MMSDATSIAIGCFSVAALIAIIYHVISLRSSRALPRPPGPKGWPIIGNALQMPNGRLWAKALEWGKTYGDIVYLENFGKPLLIINTYEVAVELLSNRSAKYSSRPPFVLMELGGCDWITSVVPYGDRLQKQRAYQHRFLHSNEVIDYIEVQAQETLVLLRGLLATPTDYAKHVRRLPGAVVMKNFYGHTVVDENDPFIKLGEVALKMLGQAQDYFVLDSLPWLRHLPDWLPWIEFPRFAKEMLSISKAITHDMPKQTMAENSTTPSAMSVLINENTRDDGTIEDEDGIGAATATLYIDSHCTYVLAMLKYPEIQERARSEVIEVTGDHRLPSFEDLEKLPFLKAVYTEVLRWYSILPFLVAHYTTEDDEYNGSLIPAGTTVLCNTWAINHNPAYFEDHENFRPERWLESIGKEGRQGAPRPDDYIFGFGRRACPGQKWAEHLLLLAMASMIACFKFEPKYENGVPIPLNDKFFESFIWHLGPSECNITPRSEKVVDLIRNADKL